MGRSFHDATVLDRATGETRHLRLQGFCEKPNGTIYLDTTGNWRGQSPRSVVRCLWILRWNRASRGQPADMQERKYRKQVNAGTKRRELARKGYKGATITPCREDGTHEIWD